MAIEHLIAALGASWILSSREAKEERRQAQAYAATAAQEQKKTMSVSEYKEKRKFNQIRQNQLMRMGTSTLLSDRQEFAKILGRPCEKKEASVTRGVRAIAEKEGWSYYDENELYYDPEYCKIIGVPPLSSVLITDYENKEAERRKKEKVWQQWAARHPQCFRIAESPEFYDTEDSFALVVKAKAYKWRDLCFNGYNIAPSRYETKEEYEQAVEQRRSEIQIYSHLIEARGLKSDIGISFFVDSVDRMEAYFKEQPANVPVKVFIYLVYLHTCLPYGGGALSSTQIDNRDILSVLAEQRGTTLDAILEEADRGTLLPKGAKMLRNNYLGTYVLTREGVWTLYPSSYYERKYGFTLNEFAKHCGNNPDINFIPPQKGVARISKE
jgi:hypothetical protein